MTARRPARYLLTALMLVGTVSLVARSCVASAEVTARDAGGGRVCGFLHARVPYATGGGGQAWRVYIRGSTSCDAASSALNTVMHLHGKNHDNGAESNSFFTYGDWTCPYGQMGTQLCVLGSPSHPRAEALAEQCSELHCPARRAPVF